MASKVFNDFTLKLGKKQYNLSSDGFHLVYVADTYGSIDADATDPNVSGFTPLSGGNFAASTALSSITYARTINVCKFDFADPAQVDKNAANPTTIRCALIVHTTSGDLYKAVDLTGGTDTPIDAVNKDFQYQVAAGGSATITIS